jgi:hypothetical protein
MHSSLTMSVGDCLLTERGGGGEAGVGRFSSCRAARSHRLSPYLIYARNALKTLQNYQRAVVV